MRKSTMLKLLCIVISAFALASVVMAAGFTKTLTYADGTFSDVKSTSWYAKEVASAYELGFMNGKTEGKFAPDGNVTVAEAITMASRVHAIYNGKEIAKTEGKWYDMYVKYALANGIISEGQYTNYDRNIMRYEMAVMFADSMPASYFAAKNDVKSIPDVDSAEEYHDKLMVLYKAGVVMGSTEYGDFLATNSIKRSETAAIINRVALPENRQEKTLKEYGDRDQAVYLIDDYVMTRTVRGMSAVASGWRYENPINTSNEKKDFSTNALSDGSNIHSLSLTKDIAVQNHGVVGFETVLSISSSGANIIFEDDNGNAVFTLSTKKDGVYANGEKTSSTYKSGKAEFFIEFNLDEKTARVVIAGNDCGTYKLSGNELARVIIETGKEEMLNLTVNKVHMYTHYAVNDRFIVQPQGKVPFDWDVTGDVKVANVASDYDTNSVKMTGVASAKKTFDGVSGKYVFETFVKVPESNSLSITLENEVKGAVARVDAMDGKFVYTDGGLIRNYTPNVWQLVRIEGDTEKGTATIKINNKKCMDITTYGEKIVAIEISSTAPSAVLFDDVQLYNVYDYADYVPTPVPVTDDEWYSGMSICSLWREGTHYGWDCVSPYDDITPVLGYYDEGLAEVSDWEIKFLVEHGYDFQHFCWYYGHELKDGVKNSRLGAALNDGFLNAKYSDMQDFMIMWENAAAATVAFDEFKTNIWSYWCDWYFSDDRYFTIDNKAVLTIYLQEKFITAMGGEEGAKAAIDFMRNDIKRLGYDDLIILATGDGRQLEAYKTADRIGIDAYIAYHFGENSFMASHQKNSLNSAYAYNSTPFLASIGIGFNDIGWTETRTPLASLEEHTEALRWAKEEYMPKVAKKEKQDWMGKFVISNTWNEYGEGHYLMPSNLNKFGYLDDARSLFSSVAGTDDKAHFDVEPTINQKKRLGYLYQAEKTPLRRTMYVSEEDSIANNKVVIGWDFETQEDCLKWGSLANTTTAPVFDAKEKALVGSTLKNDSHIHSLDILENYFEANDAKYLHIKMKTENSMSSGFEMYFLDRASDGWNAKLGFTGSHKPDGEYHDYYIDLSKNVFWKGTVKHLRFDPMNAVGKFYIKKIEFLSGEAANSFKINASGSKFSYGNSFVKNVGDEVYVAANPSDGFYYKNGFYYEWSRFTGELLIRTHTGVEFNFTVGSDKVLVDGKEKTINSKIELADGLVMLPIYFIYDNAGYEYEKTKDGVNVSVRGEEVEEIVVESKPFSYEFNSPGNTEGWNVINASGGVLGEGCMYFEANLQGSGYDPLMKLDNIGMDAVLYNRAEVRMKVAYANDDSTDEEVKIYYATTSEPNMSESKTGRVNLSKLTPDEEGFYTFTIDFSSKDSWKAQVMSLRFDAPQRAGETWIDYIRFLEDPAKIEEAKKAAEEAAKKQEIINAVDKGGPFYLDNADAEAENFDTDYGSGNTTVTVVEDDLNPGNHAFKIVPKFYDKQAWTYFIIPTRFKPGVTYKVEFDFRMLGDGQNNDRAIFPTPNFRYTDMEDGAYKEMKDHVSRCVPEPKILPEDGWMHYETTYTINESSNIRTKDYFTIFCDSYDEGGKIYNYSYMIDNIKVSVVEE